MTRFAGAVTVIVTTYRREDALDAVLRGLAGQTEPDFDVIVADDGSGPATAEVIGRWRGQSGLVIDHVWQRDQGFRAAEARNRAIRRAAGAYIVFIDGDCIPRATFIEHHRRLAEPGWMVAGNRILLSKELTQRVLSHGEAVEQAGLLRWLAERSRGGANRLLPLVDLPDGRWRRMQPLRSDGVRTCNLAVFAAELVAVDGFDAAYQGWGLEDTDLAVRLIRSGVRRKDGRLSTGVLHLWHSEGDRSAMMDNRRRLDEVMADGRLRARRGLSSLVDESA